MKKRVLLIASFLGLILLLSACGTDSNEKVEQSGTQNRRPDFGQPDTQAEIRGIVKSVLGNEVTVLKMEMGQRMASSTQERGEEGANERMATLSLNGATGATRGAGGGPGMGMGMGGGPGGEGSTDRSTLIAQIKEMSTGEEKVIIPVGIRMLKTDSSSKEMIEASISDLSADKMITIWLDSSISDRKVASFVMIN